MSDEKDIKAAENASETKNVTIREKNPSTSKKGWQKFCLIAALVLVVISAAACFFGFTNVFNVRKNYFRSSNDYYY